MAEREDEDSLEELEEGLTQSYVLVTIDEETGDPNAEVHNMSGIELIGVASYLDTWGQALLEDDEDEE